MQVECIDGRRVCASGQGMAEGPWPPGLPILFCDYANVLSNLEKQSLFSKLAGACLFNSSCSPCWEVGLHVTCLLHSSLVMLFCDRCLVLYHDELSLNCYIRASSVVIMCVLIIKIVFCCTGLYGGGWGSPRHPRGGTHPCHM